MDYLLADYVGLLVQIDLELSSWLFQSLSLGQSICLAVYLFGMAIFLVVSSKQIKMNG
ncbi:hypothetical protein KTI63_07040 [Acinetobacter guillouiae]|uniref:hypothetical protein n=1 Tax=Acinetobacter guillouiae TaxID=106649 RepID=UPI0021D35081|nr:hypothetical protein [Acinetobacter guillouiae]MCU4492229.1 hypothetical protein [Acinetobacter guillouiae]